MAEGERAMAFLGLTKNHVGIDVTPVTWDEKENCYIWHNDQKIYNGYASPALVDALVKEGRKIPLFLSKPLKKK